MADCDIKLYYFNVRGRAEFLRMLLTAAGQEFEDHRFEAEEWVPPDSQAKKDAPYGQLPYVTYKGKKYGQSLAIGTYFAKKFGFYGETDEDAFKQEEVMLLIEDASVPHIRDWIMEQDPEKKKEQEEKLREKHLPRYLTYLEALLADNGDTGFFVGKSMTLADLCLYNFQDTVHVINPEALETFPLSRKLRANVEAIPALETYIRNRAPSKI